MKRLLPQTIRAEFVTLSAELNALLSAARYNRPLSSVTIRNAILIAMECVEDLENLMLEALEGTIDEDGELWHPDDVVTLAAELPQEYYR